jgi:hypothetical protein
MMYQNQLPLGEDGLRGSKHLERVASFLKRLHAVGTARDRANNREFFCDQYLGLLLLYFFNPTVTTLRGLRKLTDLSKVQQRLGCKRVCLSALSEAGSVFDPEPVRQILVELGGAVAPVRLPAEQAALQTLTVVDGSLLPALPRMMWALWQDERHHAAKLHLQFEVARGIPVQADITTGASSEIDQLRHRLQSGILYVLDRGYVSYRLLAEIMDQGASFIVRVKENTAFTVAEERTVSPEAKAAGIVRDVMVDRLGTDHHKKEVHRPVRIVELEVEGSRMLLLTDQLDMPAELVALAYRYRWSIELFFRWFKCVLGCRHWLGESLNALTLQVYAGLIASLLLSVWTGQKPTKRTFEMVCHYMSGWATEEELQAHLDETKKQPKQASGP